MPSLVHSLDVTPNTRRAAWYVPFKCFSNSSYLFFHSASDLAFCLEMAVPSVLDALTNQEMGSEMHYRYVGSLYAPGYAFELFKKRQFFVER